VQRQLVQAGAALTSRSPSPSPPARACLLLRENRVDVGHGDLVEALDVHVSARQDLALPVLHRPLDGGQLMLLDALRKSEKRSSDRTWWASTRRSTARAAQLYTLARRPLGARTFGAAR
jgi:hypothetical protein